MKPTQPPESLSPKSLLGEVQALLQGEKVWIVGGWLRDAILGRESHDLDLAAPRGSWALAHKLAEALPGTFVPLDRERGCARVVLQWQGERWEIDCTDFRAPTLEGDLRARDFSLNALAAPLQNPKELIDPTGGLRDLEAGTIRLLSAQALEEDPLRVLRAIRFSAELGFEITSQDRDLLRQASARLHQSAPERCSAEILRAMDSPHPLRAGGEFKALGVAQSLFPQAEEGGLDALMAAFRLEQKLRKKVDLDGSSYDLGRYSGLLREHLDELLEGERSRKSWWRWAIFLLGSTRQASADLLASLKALRFSRGLVNYVDRLGKARAWLEDSHLEFAAEDLGPEVRRGAYRLFHLADSAYLDTLLWAWADVVGSKAGRAFEPLLRIPFEHPEVLEPQAFLNGSELQRALNLDPGPRVGEILEALREAQAVGEIRDRAEALAFATRIHAEIR